jgi:hypothetical protein
MDALGDSLKSHPLTQHDSKHKKKGGGLLRRLFTVNSKA